MAKQISNHLVKKAKKIMANEGKRMEQNRIIESIANTDRIPSVMVDNQTYKVIAAIAKRNRRSFSETVRIILHNYGCEYSGRKEQMVYLSEVIV